MSAAPRLEELARLELVGDGGVTPRLHAAAAAIAVASPDELQRASLQRRFDRRFLLPLEAAAPLLELIRNDYHVVLAGASRFAQYDTRYFDTPDLRFYHDHHRRRRPRVKVRVRHYIDRALSMLELKQKTVKGDTVEHRWDRDADALALSHAEQELAASSIAPIDTHGPLVTLVDRGLR